MQTFKGGEVRNALCAMVNNDAGAVSCIAILKYKFYSPFFKALKQLVLITGFLHICMVSTYI